VLTGTMVEAVERHGRRWAVTTAHACKTLRIKADAVVIAVPAAEAARLLEPLSGVVSGRLEGIVYAPMAVLALGFRDQDVSRPLDGIGCLVPGREKKISPAHCGVRAFLPTGRRTGARLLPAIWVACAIRRCCSITISDW